jgi:hypothetical protein
VSGQDRELSADQATSALGEAVTKKLREIDGAAPIHKLAKLRRAIEGLERAKPDDPLSPFIGEEVVALGDVLAVIDLASADFWANGGGK